MFVGPHGDMGLHGGVDPYFFATTPSGAQVVV